MSESEEGKAMPTAAKKTAPEAPPLGDAGASTDPVVQGLVAALEIAERNGDKDAADEVRDRLKELGVA